VGFRPSSARRAPGLRSWPPCALGEETDGDPLAAVLAALDRIPGTVYAASGMVRVGPESRVAGHAFVPVGRGHAPGVAFPFGGAMVLGQDFGNERDLDAAIAAGEETNAIPTWREIGKALRAEDIPLDACWRTNYVMGVRRGYYSNCKGPSPGLRGGDLRRACRDLFARQVRAQMPCALVVLGTNVPKALAADFPHAFATWAAGSFALRDAADGAAIRDADIDGVSVPLVVSILHPSLRGPNLSKRRFGGRQGAEAERSLLRLVRDVVRERWTPPARGVTPGSVVGGDRTGTR
jgi:hypothetical protein